LNNAFYVFVSYMLDKHGETIEQLASKLDMESTARLFWKLFPEVDAILAKPSPLSALKAALHIE